MRLPPNAFGFDTVAPQNQRNPVPSAATPREKIEAMLLWMATRTNLSYLGGYITGTSTGWHDVFADTWLAGWGLAIFDNGTKQNNNVQEWIGIEGKKQLHDTGRANPYLTEANGRTDASEVLKRANSILAPRLVRSVVYVDVEESNPLSKDFLDYLRGIFSFLETAAPGMMQSRPGIYAHINLITPLLADFPYLYVCDNAYGNRQGRPDLDGQSITGSPAPPLTVEFQAGVNNAIPRGPSRNLVTGSNRTRGPRRDWRAWPAIFQYEGDNHAPLSPVRAQQYFQGLSYELFGVPWNNMDYQSALVNDPAYPCVSPRVAVAPGAANVAILTRTTPGDPASLQGVLATSVLTPGASGAFSIPTAGPRAYGFPVPHHRPAWFRAGSHTMLVTPIRDGAHLTLGTHELWNSRLVACPPAGFDLSLHDRWAVTGFDDRHAALFCAKSNGDLLIGKGDPDGWKWGPLESVAQGRVHTYSNLVATSRRGQSTTAYFIDSDRLLHTAGWDGVNKSDQAIGRDPDALLPTTALAAVSPDPDSLVVVGVGYDLRLRVCSWTSRGGPKWTGPYVVGNEDELLAAHTDLSIAWNALDQVVQILAVSDTLRVCLYRLRPKDPTWATWETTASRSVLFEPSISAAVNEIAEAPNPFGDLGLTFANGQRFAVAVFNIRPGRTELRCAAVPVDRPRSLPLTWVKL
jgi:hypothetical protein